MLALIFILVSLQHVSPKCISYFKGWSNDFYNYLHPDFSCKNGVQYQTTFQFPNEFCALPQIMISDLGYRKTGQNSFSFRILSQTTTQFQVSLQCNSADELRGYTFQYLAFLDNKMLVINDFVESITLIDGYRSKVFPYPIENVDYEISVTILSYLAGSPNIIIEKQSTGFNLYVTGVDSQQLSGLGVQIVAGFKEIYYQYDSTQLACGGDKKFEKTAGGLVTLPTQNLIFTFSNFYDQITKIGFYYYNVGAGKYYLCIVSYQNGICPANSIVNAGLWIYNFKLQPHYYAKIRVSHLMSLDHKLMNSFITQKVYFIQGDQTMSDLSAAAIPLIQFEQEKLSLVYYHQCQPNRKITVTVLKYGRQGFYNYKSTDYCHRLYNLITMYIYLYQSRVGPSEIQFTLNNLGFQVQQKMLDTGDTYQVLNVQWELLAQYIKHQYNFQHTLFPSLLWFFSCSFTPHYHNIILKFLIFIQNSSICIECIYYANLEAIAHLFAESLFFIFLQYLFVIFTFPAII